MKLLRSLVLLGVLASVVVLGAAWYLGGQRPSAPSSGQPLAGLDASLADGSTRNLSTDDVDDLRAAGWTCPDLNTVGYWTESAELTERGGQPAVVADLRSTAHALTLVEQHPDRAATGMIDGATGRAVSTDVYRRVTSNGTELWVARSATGATSDVVFRVADAVYSLRSDTSPADAVKVASVIAAADNAQVDRSAPAGDDDLVHRVVRGLNRLTGQP
ncbi:hypothetical protein GCM10011512_29360 [Tersicoccus solisilvae]|uniref:PknH-like extracellular domain-containing protein n=1 Tax=Tersicoccus solisilvae TaxID=1882339 RepID=A0ABQ1PPQ7_9MICC|nr:hypothetical protein [Tersicoccus solisilvae]GGD00621.1 hypothetical protein GCM10011512_29360 [Tersicoccus solisilvae]